MESQSPKYKRILLKRSGEALAAGADGIINYDFVHRIGKVLKKCVDSGAQIGIIVGAGNIWRGRQGKDMDSVRADYMGMLATAINALALQDTFRAEGIDARVMTSISMPQAAEPYVRDKAIHHLENGRVVIFGCGLGSPFFSTDTAAALRAAEIGADVILMAKNIDGIYTADPKTDKTAKKLDYINYRDILSGGLRAIDSTATAFCMDNNIPIFVFGLDNEENIYRAVMGEALGTLVSND
jgi:uridylate kinase